jgi:hypothetical protein
MKRYTYTLGALVVGGIIACAPVKFEKQVNCGGSCTYVNGMLDYDVQVNVSGGKVDVLFVDDNSASMSTEQHAVATRFSSFINTLDAQSIDYRIGIITTSLSSPANNSPYKDGNLVSFSDGSKFIVPTSTNKITMFASAIERQETINCESFLAANPNLTTAQYQANCPSPDERGIYAANLTIQNNPSGFIRGDAALAVIFLSDEDERSSLYPTYAQYSVEELDMPQTLISKVQSYYPGKSFTAHSIIAKPGPLNGVSAQVAADRIWTAWNINGDEASNALPTNLFSGGDSTCLNTQGTQINNVSGSYGYLYALATRLTSGVEGDVCASDYASQLSSIGNQLTLPVNSISLACASPTDLTVTFLIGSTVSHSVSGSQIQFVSNLAPGTQVRVQYKCPVTL